MYGRLLEMESLWLDTLKALGITVLIAWLILRDKGGLRPYKRRAAEETCSGRHYG